MIKPVNSQVVIVLDRNRKCVDDLRTIMDYFRKFESLVSVARLSGLVRVSDKSKRPKTHESTESLGTILQKMLL